MPVSYGLLEALLVIVIVAVGLLALLRLAIAPNDRAVVARVVAAAVCLRMAVAALLYYGSLEIGRQGFIVGDDKAYAELADGVVSWLRGVPKPPYIPPWWAGQAYLLGTYPYVGMAVFAVFGSHAILMTFVNAGFAGGLLILLYGLASRIFGRRPAFLAVSIIGLFPSLVLWSALNLKDALASLLIVSVFWLLLRFQLRPHWSLLFAFVIVVIPIESIRRYVYQGLLMLFPIGVALSPSLWTAGQLSRVGGKARLLSWVGASIAIALVLLPLGGGQGTYGSLGTFDAFESIRQNMALGARTSFADSRPVVVNDGDTFVVTGEPAIQTGEPAIPTTTKVPITPRVVNVPPESRILLCPPETIPAPSSSPAATRPVVCVRPGDIVVVGAPDRTAAPAEKRQALSLKSDRISDGAQFYPTSSSAPEALILARTISYLPRGAAYAFLAPFPWDIQRPLDWLTMPEMLMWYVTLVVLPFSLWKTRSAWRYYLPLLLYVGGMMVIFVLVEGNFGTLFRHRAMVIPIAIVLASPGLLWVADAIRSRVRLPR